jgi:hypothetical protein
MPKVLFQASKSMNQTCSCDTSVLSGTNLNISVIRPVMSGGIFTGHISLVGGIVGLAGVVL